MPPEDLPGGTSGVWAFPDNSGCGRRWTAIGSRYGSATREPYRTPVAQQDGAQHAWGNVARRLGKVDTGEIMGPLDGNTGYGVFSLTPAAVTLVLAFWSRNVFVALVCGILAGAVVTFAHTGDPASLNVIDRFLLPALGSERYAQILLVYLWCLGGLLGLWEATGAAARFGRAIGRYFRGYRGSKLFTVLSGCMFHQGGTVSCVLTGATARPVTQEGGVPPTEFAFLLDSTASPVAALIPFNAWPVYVAGLIAGTTVHGVAVAPDAAAGLGWYIAAIPWNVYAIGTVLLAFLAAADWWPFVPTWRTEKEETVAVSKDSQPVSQETVSGYRPGLAEFFVPLVVLLGVTFLPRLLRLTGREVLPYFGTRSEALNEAFLLAVVSAVAVAVYRGVKLQTALEAFLHGCQTMTVGAIILGLAVTLGEVSRSLDPANYLASLVVHRLPIWTLPACLFSVSATISFATGSSWATYAVVLPIAVPVTCAALISAAGGGEASIVLQEPSTRIFLAACIAAVIGGGVFGDHCSPVSDTTILASVFARCDVMDHALTQLPLGLQVAGISLLAYVILGLLLT